MTDVYPSDGTESEFGGVSGLIQPAPHEPEAAEKLMILHGVRSDSLGDSPETSLLRLQGHDPDQG